MGLNILFAAFAAWFLAQALKVIITLFRDKKFDLKRFVESGGMPSSHTALVIGLSTSIAKYEGLHSTYFAIAIIFSLVVMYDAAGVRRAAGRQAAILNKIIQDIYQHKYTGKSLKELLGHTPKEVLAGAILGVAIGLLL